MPKHILVATDGSELAAKAITYAINLARDTNAKLTAVTVSEAWSPLEIASKAQAGHFTAIAEFESHAADIAGKILAKAVGQAKTGGISMETRHVADSRPADGIVATAQDDNCDLIVMASHGRRGVSKLVLGSQAQEVLGNTTIPVLICR